MAAAVLILLIYLVSDRRTGESHSIYPELR